MEEEIFSWVDGMTVLLDSREISDKKDGVASKSAKMKTLYIIKTDNGQRTEATSLRQAKKIARFACARQVGSWSNMMTSGRYLPTHRIYWQEWDDGTIVGHPNRGYSGDNPQVVIRKTRN